MAIAAAAPSTPSISGVNVTWNQRAFGRDPFNTVSATSLPEGSASTTAIHHYGSSTISPAKRRDVHGGPEAEHALSVLGSAVHSSGLLADPSGVVHTLSRRIDTATRNGAEVAVRLAGEDQWKTWTGTTGSGNAALDQVVAAAKYLKEQAIG